LQTIVSRNVPAIDTAVVSLGHVAAGDFNAPNIMPSEVVVRGTSRSYTPIVRDLLEKRLTELAHATAAAFGCTAVVDYDRRYPPLVNHSEQTDISAAAAAALVGESHVIADAPQQTGAEDFSFMLEARPGGFMMIGAGLHPDGSFHNVHTPGYDFNDQILTLGAGYWVSLVQEELA
jgi:hippurate hydrolase